MKKLQKAFVLLCCIGSLTAYSQGAQAVYDATLHQQTIINHNAVVNSHNLTRQWLSTILEQEKLTGREIYKTKNDLVEALEKIENKVGDASKLTVNVTNVAPGQLYENKDLATIRSEGLSGKVSDQYNANKLYGKDKEDGAAARVAEAAYINYEEVLRKSTEDKIALLRKREALASYLDGARNLVEVEKLKAAILVIDSRLTGLYENEKNAALKALVVKSRNESGKELVQDATVLGTIAATDAMTDIVVDNFKNLSRTQK